MGKNVMRLSKGFIRSSGLRPFFGKASELPRLVPKRFLPGRWVFCNTWGKFEDFYLQLGRLLSQNIVTLAAGEIFAAKLEKVHRIGA